MKRTLLTLLTACGLLSAALASDPSTHVAAIINADGTQTPYETLAAAVAAVPIGGEEPTTIALLANVESGGIVVQHEKQSDNSYIGKKIVFDLRNHTYTVIGPTVGSANTDTNGFQLLKGSVVTFKNGGLEITCPKGGILLQNYGDLTLENVTLNAGKTLRELYTVSNNCGSMTVKGNTKIYASEGGAAFDLWYGMSTIYREGITVTFDDTFTGKVVGKVEYGRDSNASDVADWQAKTKLEIAAPKGTFNITLSESSTGALTGANIAISGGAFSSRPSSAYCAEGYVSLPREGAGYDVLPGTWCASVGEEKYATLQEAVSAAPESSAVTLLCDVMLKEPVALSGDCTLDLAGYTLYAPNPSTPAFTSPSAATLTLQESTEGGKVIAAAQQSTGTNVTIEGSGLVAITKWTDEGAYDDTWVPKNKPTEAITLETSAQLAGLAYAMNTRGAKLDYLNGANIVLAADMDFSALEWVPIDDFRGTLDGKTWTLSGLRINAEGKGGLFATLSGTVENLRVEGAQVTVTEDSGAWDPDGYGGVLAGDLAGGTISRCAVQGATLTATATTNVRGLGGLVGRSTGGTVRDVFVDAEVTAPSDLWVYSFVGAGTGSLTNAVSPRQTNGDAEQANGDPGTPAVTLRNVHTYEEGIGWVRASGLASEAVETVNFNAELNGIGWVMNREPTEAGKPVWYVDSNEAPTTLLPFASGTVQTVPAVEPYITVETIEANGVKIAAYFANGHGSPFDPAIVEEDEEGRTVMRIRRDDYDVDETCVVVPREALGETEVAVFGGSYRQSLNSTNLTLKGGTVLNAVGGSFEASVEVSSLTVEGGTVKNVAAGGCQAIANGQDITVGRSSSITVTGGTIRSAFGGSFAGSYGANTPNKFTVKEVKTTVSGGTVTYLFGGNASGYLYTDKVVLTISGGTFKEVIGGSSNGEIGTLSMTLTGGAVSDSIFAVNRGKIGSVTMALGQAFNPRYGICLSNCQESVDTTGEIIDGTITLMNNAANQGTVYFGSTYGQAKAIIIGGSQPVQVSASASATKGGDVTIPEGQALTLGSKATLTVPADATLTVKGTVKVGSGAALVGTNGSSTLVNAGTLEGLSADGVTLWNEAQKAWLAAAARSGDTYYASVQNVLATLSAGTDVALLSRDAANEQVSATSNGKTVTQGEAYDVAALLGGTFKVNEGRTGLVYAYDLGVMGLPFEKNADGSLTINVQVGLQEHGSPVTRTLPEGSKVVLLVACGDGEKGYGYIAKGDEATFTEGRCTVAMPYNDLTLGTNRFTVQVTDAATIVIPGYEIPEADVEWGDGEWDEDDWD